MVPARPLPAARSFFRWGGIVLAVAVSAAAPGCVQRRMTVRSSPPGALVYVDDYQIGSTPVSTDFIYYGTRKIRLVKDGFETLTVRQPFPMPWYQVFPLDFVTENLWPWEIRDERVVDLAMTPLGEQSAEEVVARAQQMRLAAGSLPPAPSTTPPPLPALPRAWQGAAPAPVSPPQGPLAFPAPALQAPVQNAPAQGLPSLGLPPSGF